MTDRGTALMQIKNQLNKFQIIITPITFYQKSQISDGHQCNDQCGRCVEVDAFSRTSDQ